MTKLLNWVETNWLPLTILMLAAILVASLWPYGNMPSVPGNDKTHHFIAYGLLMFPTALRKPKRWLLIGLLFLLFSGAIELIQPYVNRFGEWSDMLANSCGILIGILLARLCPLMARKNLKSVEY